MVTRTHLKVTFVPYRLSSFHYSFYKVSVWSVFVLPTPETVFNKERIHLDHLNAELNPICHLLVLLEDLTFMGPCIVSISNKMQRYTIYLYLETALHISSVISTHHQERIQLYLQHLVFVTPLLLSAAIVEELEQV
jgi:hypothetical protein